MKKIIPLFLCLLLLCSCGSKSASLNEKAFYKELPEVFTFASGVGGWATEVSFNDDGSFSGSYHDSDMGDADVSYPYGTIYVCLFNGKLKDLTRINDYTYSAYVEDMTCETEPGKEWIEDEIRYISSEPYGFDNAQEILFYLPGAPLKDLPAEYTDWISMPMAWGTDDRPEALPFYGLYNVSAQEGFFS